MTAGPVSMRCDSTFDPALEEPLACPPSLADQLRFYPTVVAVTGGQEGAGPVRVAAALERRYASRVLAVQVRDTSEIPLLVPLPTAFTFAHEPFGDAPYAKDARERRQELSGWLGKPNEWPVHIALGAAAYEVLHYAEHTRAALIVMGLRHHGTVHRVLHDETTLTVARQARATVVAVTPGLQHLPRHAVVGVDFGPASIRVARATLDVLATDHTDDAATLQLVYVDRDKTEGEREETAGEGVIRRLGIAAAFDELVAELEAPSSVHVTCVGRRGDPAAELLAVADEASADVIAVGSLRHERIERSIVGSVTTEIIRDGRCSVLVIPPVHGD